MIPKLIHYCWFGGNEKPEEVTRCIKSWKKCLPDFTIIEWNEKNFDLVNSNQYVREAYQRKKWAFVSDYVRLKVLYESGGIYLDTDVEVFKSFNDLLDNSCFFGFESRDYVGSAVMGCEKHNEFIGHFCSLYNNRIFVRSDDSLDITTNVAVLTKLLHEKGLTKNGKNQILIDGIRVFEQSYFASNDFRNVFGKYRKNIYAYHHCLSSWYNVSRGRGKKVLLRHYIVGKLRNIIGTDVLNRIKNRQ